MSGTVANHGDSEARRGKAPSANSQAPENNQISNFNIQTVKVAVVGGGYNQESNFKPLTRWNSRILLVTSVRP